MKRRSRKLSAAPHLLFAREYLVGFVLSVAIQLPLGGARETGRLALVVAAGQVLIDTASGSGEKVRRRSAYRTFPFIAIWTIILEIFFSNHKKRMRSVM